MSAADVLTPVLAFAGAAIGAGLVYLGTRSGVAQEERQSRREEWGRRFTAALNDVPDPWRQWLGVVLLGKLARSELASPEERELADDLLTQAANRAPHGTDLRLATRHGELADFRIVEDTDGGREGAEDDVEDDQG
jgi:hypothetical protein